jgi:hypothetical protein
MGVFLQGRDDDSIQLRGRSCRALSVGEPRLQLRHERRVPPNRVPRRAGPRPTVRGWAEPSGGKTPTPDRSEGIASFDARFRAALGDWRRLDRVRGFGGPNNPYDDFAPKLERLFGRARKAFDQRNMPQRSSFLTSS